MQSLKKHSDPSLGEAATQLTLRVLSQIKFSSIKNLSQLILSIPDPRSSHSLYSILPNQSQSVSILRPPLTPFIARSVCAGAAEEVSQETVLVTGSEAGLEVMKNQIKDKEDLLRLCEGVKCKCCGVSLRTDQM